MCVFDRGFTGPLDGALAAEKEKEQQWLGRALLGTYQARAQKEGVGAGKPKTSSALFTLRPGKVQRIAEQVRQNTEVGVIVVSPEE